jgi:uncharacterized protein (DUF2267 family)
MTYAELIAKVRGRGAFGSDDEAERALVVSARVLGEVLSADEAEAVARALPEALAARVRSATSPRAADVADLFERVARREGVRASIGTEHAQIVLQVLGEALPTSVRARLQKHLGPSFGQLLEPPAVLGAPPPPIEHAPPSPEPGRGTTLATGRPGSRHPLSEAGAERAHADSVARADDPHSDTKLSSSRGLTQERLGETLAEGKPKSVR